MTKLKYSGPIPHGHIVYGPVTQKPYRVHPDQETNIDDEDAQALLDTGHWARTRGRKTKELENEQLSD